MTLRDELLELSQDFEDCALAIVDDHRRDAYWPSIDRLRNLAHSMSVPADRLESAEWWDSLLAAVDAETAEPVYRADCDDDGTCRVCGAPCGSTHLSDCRTYHVEYNPDRVAFDVVAYHAATDTFTTLDAGLSATEADRRVRQLREGR